ncbi:hypothetical protein N9948_00805 [bacterium]|nr:hypothetical protein [bacterium]
MKPDWRMLKKFIDDNTEMYGDSWLDNEFFMECSGPHHEAKTIKSGEPVTFKSGWTYIKDGEGWDYVQPAWVNGSANGESHGSVLATTFKDKKIVTLNINY